MKRYAILGFALAVLAVASGTLDSGVSPTRASLNSGSIAVTKARIETSTPIARLEEAKADASRKANVLPQSRGAKGQPSGHIVGFPGTAFEYAKMVEPLLGVPPKIDLGEAVEIPLYVDAVQTWGNLGSNCDNPTYLGKDTISGSVLQRYEGITADGRPLPDVVWVSFGRNSGNRPDNVTGSVQMIGYHRKTGATAFFESSDHISPWIRLDEGTLRMRGVMPWIDEPREFNRAFETPGSVQCVQCHQNDPFITNSFITAARIPGTEESVVPILDQDSPYYVIGGDDWDMRTMHLSDNQCFSCHRVGMSTMTLFMSNGWDPNEHMPPHDPGSLAADLRELLRAWQEGPDNVERAEWIIPPARGNARRIVGQDYPHQAGFNRPGKNGFSGKAEATRKGLDAFAARLKELAAAGKLSEEEAVELYNAAFRKQ